MNKEKIVELVTSEKVYGDTKILIIEKEVGFGACSSYIEEKYWSKDANKLKDFVLNVDLVYTLSDLLLKRNIDKSMDELYELDLQGVLNLINDEKLVNLVNEFDIYCIKEKTKKLENILKELGCNIKMHYYEDIEEAINDNKKEMLNELYKDYLYNGKIEKVLLIMKNYAIKYESKTFRKLARDIVFDTIDHFFGISDDETSKELLNDGNINGYIEHLKMCYGHENIMYASLTRLKEILNVFLDNKSKESFVRCLQLLNNELRFLGYEDYFEYCE